MELVLSWIWLAVVAWLILRAFRQRDVLHRVTLSDTVNGAADAPRVAVIVPARDEAANIGPCVRSLLAQRYPADRLSIIVIDDDSSDGTANIVAELIRGDRCRGDGKGARTESARGGGGQSMHPRLTLLRTPPLPPGWKGKVHACCIGAAAVDGETEWLCFLDADMRAHPLLIASALDAASARNIDLLSLAPRHELRSFAERLILPCGLYLLAFSQDLPRIQSPDSAEVVATGQFMLLRRRAYESVGGHASVRAEICEDVELARLLKRAGYHVLMQDGSDVLSTRMYTGWSTLWPGIAKNLIEMLGGAGRTIATAALAVVLAWAAVLIPLFDSIGCHRGSREACLALVPALMGSAAAFGLHLAGAIHFRIPFWYGLLFPVGYTAGAIIALDSIRWRLTGRIRWKGRVYQ